MKTSIAETASPERPKMTKWLWVFIALWLVPAAAGGPQSVEVLFTPTVLQEAVALKEGLRVGRLESTSALSLVGASADRKKAYSDKVATSTAVVIIGEDALKAVADLEFSTTVIALNASGHTAAKGRVIRVFDGASAPADAQAAPSASSVKALIGADNKEVSLKGPATAVIQGVLDTLK